MDYCTTSASITGRFRYWGQFLAINVLLVVAVDALVVIPSILDTGLVGCLPFVNGDLINTLQSLASILPAQSEVRIILMGLMPILGHRLFCWALTVRFSQSIIELYGRYKSTTGCSSWQELNFGLS